MRNKEQEKVNIKNPVKATCRLIKRTEQKISSG